MNRRDFTIAVDNVLTELPEWVVERVDNLTVIIEDWPTPDQDPTGVERAVAEGRVDESFRWVDRRKATEQGADLRLPWFLPEPGSTIERHDVKASRRRLRPRWIRLRTVPTGTPTISAISS